MSESLLDVSRAAARQASVPGTESTQRRDLRAVRLTPAELRVMRLRAQGLSNKEIAHAISRSEQTVKNHQSHVAARLETHSLVQTFFRLGWINVP